ncbi:MAG: substrate-binding domain-containing protein [Opitutaceae bacterium]|nr:substrate-binding domain-containing protein [Opitutaceae bacterium]
MAFRLTFAAMLLAVMTGCTRNEAQNLSALPDYKPSQQVTGVIRSCGNDQMATLLKYWQEGFQKYHPKVQFQDWLKGSASGMYGLEMRTSDTALMGRPIGPFERYGIYERSWIFPIEIEVATGAHEALHKSPAVAIFVHKDNPLTKLTVKQLDGIFGAQRGGGWVGLSWNDKAARGPEGNIRTWGQLGVQGPLADKPIHVYGQPNLGAGYVSFFEARVFGGGRIWNEDLREYSDRTQMIADLSQDPYGIAYAALGNKAAGVKPVALAETDAGPFVELTKSSVADRSYPLARAAYIYYTIDNEKSELSETRGDPRVKEFLRYILSKQGQQEVAREGVYLPLTPAVVQAQLQKIDSEESPWEREVLD